jgi:hypothetical protein
VAARRTDDDRDLADADPADPVPRDGRSRSETPLNVPLKVRQRAERRRPVGLVVEARHPTRRRGVRSDAAGEQYHAAVPSVLERAERGGD